MDHYGVSRWPDAKDILKRMDKLVNDRIYSLKPEALKGYLKYFEEKCQTSKLLTDKAKQRIPSAVQHNLAFNYPFPLAIKKAEGAYLTDADGNEYIDYLQCGGPIILGNNYKPVQEKVMEVIKETGPVVGLFNEYEFKLAEIINKYMPHVEKYRALASGTESDMVAIRVARAFTGKKKIIKEGSAYHGWSDQLVYSLHMPDTGTYEAHGIPKECTANTTDFYPGDIEDLRRQLIENEKDGGTAAVLLEPFGPESGTRPNEKDFCKKVREICDEFGTLLIFDEVVTGFRVGPGGAAGYFGVVPDLTVFGKIVSGGYPMAGGVGGREDVMSVVAAGVQSGKPRAYAGGTLTANPLSCAAGYYAIKEIVEKDAAKKAGENGDKLCDGINELVKKYDLPFVVWNTGSILHFEMNGFMYLSGKDPEMGEKYAARKKNLEEIGAALTANGVITLAGSRIYTSMADNDETIAKTLAAFDDVFKNIEK